MIDLYEYREDSPTTDNGTPLKYFPSYIFINNKPKWDSVEYWYNKIVTLGEKLEDNITYMGKGVEDKVKSKANNKTDYKMKKDLKILYRVLKKRIK